MNLKKHSIALLFFASIVLGVSGAYVGNKLANSNDPIQQPIADNGKQVIVDTPENLTKVAQALSLIKQHYLEEVDEENLVEGAIRGMLETLEDPYSSYLDLESAQQFNEHIESSFEGIGAEVSLIDGIVTIVAPIKDSPAEEAGLRPNDQIIKIDQEGIEGLDLNQAVDKIRGEKGTEVALEILRPGVSEPFEITVVRDEIPIETVYAEVDETEGKQTGIIEITTFSENTADDFTNELEKMEESGIDGLVIDVRGNPGGLLNVVEDILKEFVPKDIPYVQT